MKAFGQRRERGRNRAASDGPRSRGQGTSNPSSWRAQKDSNRPEPQRSRQSRPIGPLTSLPGPAQEFLQILVLSPHAKNRLDRLDLDAGKTASKEKEAVVSAAARRAMDHRLPESPDEATETPAGPARTRNYAASTAPIYSDWTWLLSVHGGPRAQRRRAFGADSGSACRASARRSSCLPLSGVMKGG